MGGLHVVGSTGDRDVEVKIEAKDRPRDQYDKDGESGILKIGDLDFHGPELDAPARVFVMWWRLEAHVLPICGLKVFEVVGFIEVEVLEVFSEDDNGITDEQVGKVGG